MNFSVITDNLSYLLLGPYPDGPLGGAALTLLLSIASSIISAAIGLLAGIALAFLKKGIVRQLLFTLLTFFRAIPILMLIFWVYFLLPILFHLNVPAIFTVVCALSLIGGAYLGYAVYAGIQSLPAGQWQASSALGFTRWQTMRYVVLPQSLPMMLPSFVNQWVSLIKDTSLGYVIGVGELSFVATQVSNRVMVYPAEIFLFVALLYYLFCIGITGISKLLLRHSPSLQTKLH